MCQPLDVDFVAATPTPIEPLLFDGCPSVTVPLAVTRILPLPPCTALTVRVMRSEACGASWPSVQTTGLEPQVPPCGAAASSRISAGTVMETVAFAGSGPLFPTRTATRSRWPSLRLTCGAPPRRRP